ncbi:hypothetical protein, partial [Tahibacter caeni]|uniref:hypothetical protein n=1 Tax=Tahibacter caeni TaxID=1453545 RepID=UPI002148ADB1
RLRLLAYSPSPKLIWSIARGPRRVVALSQHNGADLFRPSLKVSGGDVAKSLIVKNRSFVIVIGRYRAADRLLSTGNESSVLVGGSITVDASGSALGPWGFQTPPPSLIKKSIGD